MDWGPHPGQDLCPAAPEATAASPLPQGCTGSAQPRKLLRGCRKPPLNQQACGRRPPLCPRMGLLVAGVPRPFLPGSPFSGGLQNPAPPDSPGSLCHRWPLSSTAALCEGRSFLSRWPRDHSGAAVTRGHRLVASHIEIYPASVLGPQV